MNWAKIAVIGGINLDILGVPRGAYRERDSLIGSVSFRPGGVGRNIAAQAVQLGADVTLITAFGQDRNAEFLMEACREDGIRISDALRFSAPTSVYLAIHDETGDMVSAVNDMHLTTLMTPEALSPTLPAVNAAQVCVLDANLPEETLRFLAEELRVPLLCDPVSIEKAKRTLPILPYLTAFKPNFYEAQALSGQESPEDCAQWLLDRGVQNVLISMGGKGVYYADCRQSGCLTPSRLSARVQTGAGDAMAAGIAVAMASGGNVAQWADAGMQAAARHLKG